MRDPSDMAHVGGIFKRAPLALPAVHWKERGVRPWRRVMAGEITGKPMAGYQEFQVPYRDVDLNGEMFRGAYLYHAEEALADFWRHRKPVVDDPFFVVSKLNLTFHQPLRLGEHVRMTVAVSKIGGKSAASSSICGAARKISPKPRSSGRASTRNARASRAAGRPARLALQVSRLIIMPAAAEAGSRPSRRGRQGLRPRP